MKDNNFESIADIQESLREINELISDSNRNSIKESVAITVKDLSELAAPYLTPSAKYDQSQKATSLSVKADDGQFYSAIYFAIRVRTGDEELAVEYLARILNDLSQRGLIHSTLAPISSLELARTSEVQQSVVYSFVLIPHDMLDKVKAKYPNFVIEEGGAGLELYDLSVPLSQGEFLAEIRISYAQSMISKFDQKVTFQEILEQYLALLPKGTRVRKVTQLTEPGLHLAFEVKFFHPLLQHIKRVELQHVREFARFGESIQEYSLLTGIRYFEKDNKELYR